jgi:hypothetical protein
MGHYDNRSPFDPDDGASSADDNGLTQVTRPEDVGLPPVQTPLYKQPLFWVVVLICTAALGGYLAWAAPRHEFPFDGGQGLKPKPAVTHNAVAPASPATSSSTMSPTGHELGWLYREDLITAGFVPAGYAIDPKLLTPGLSGDQELSTVYLYGTVSPYMKKSENPHVVAWVNQPGALVLIQIIDPTKLKTGPQFTCTPPRFPGQTADRVVDFDREVGDGLAALKPGGYTTLVVTRPNYKPLTIECVRAQ